MTVARSSDLVEAARSLHLLEPAQLAQLAALQARFPEARALARELLRLDWLTPYQINQLFQDRGSDLLLGSYVLLERLGEGGMGAVFKARNWKLGRVVALKLIRKECLADAEAVQRFRREIRVASHLDHPNIIHTYDADEVGSSHFLVMEHVEGTDLARLVRQRGPLRVASACDYVRQAALGLQHAFERGLVHRDIKPSNLLLASSGVVKVLDFGLVRLSPAAAELTTTLTDENVVMGTPDFMSPEQSLGSHAVDIRADLYSLGCALYFLLTAQVPFPGGTVGEKIARHLAQEPVPVEQVRSDVPATAAAVVRKLLAKRPEDRYQTPAGLAVVLQFAGTTSAGAPPEPTLASTTIVPARPARRRLTWRHWLAGAGIALLLAGGGLALFWRHDRDEATRTVEGAPPGADKVVPRGPRPLTNLKGVKPGPEDLAAAGLGKGQRPPDELTAVLGDCRQGAGAFRAVAWSAGGKLLAAAGADGIIRLWRTVQGGEAMLLKGHPGLVFSLAFAEGGSTLVSGGMDGSVRLWDCATGRQRHRLQGRNGHVLSVAVGRGRGGPLVAAGTQGRKVELWDGSQGALLDALDAGKEYVSAVAYSPDGEVLASGSMDGQVKLWGPLKGKLLDRLPPQRRGVFRLAFSGDGRWLAVAFRDGEVLLWDRNASSRAFSWSAHTGYVEGLAFRPDSKALATAGGDGMVKLWDLATRAADKQVAVAPAGNLLKRERSVGHVAFRPDGRYLATANPNGTVWILRVAP
jgi:tRNA A-37 threonylcarbamoyl transferase component Bud32